MLSYVNVFSFFLFFSTGLTVCYSFRLVYYSITGDFNSRRLHPLNDSGWTILFRICFLTIIAVIGGSILRWLMFLNPAIICLPLEIKLLTLFVCIVGGLIGYLIRDVKLFFTNKALYFYNFTNFVGSIWFIPVISTLGVINYPLKLGLYSYKSFDQGWREFFGGQIVYSQLKNYSLYLQEFQSNSLKIYLLSYILWFIILLILVVLVN